VKDIESCIYLIINKANNKFYIGSTCDFQKRKTTHLRDLKANKHHSRYLQRAFNKYGASSFEIVIYHFCTENEKVELEQYYIDCMKPFYNTSKSAKCPMLGRKHSKKTLKLFKNRPVRYGKDNHMFGIKLSQSTKDKMRQARTGTKRSESTKKKMSDTAKRINSISRIDRTKAEKKILDQNGIIYKSLSDAAKKTRHSVQAVCDNLKGRSIKTRRKYTFKYA